MNRDHRAKMLDCAVCGRPTPAGSEATRVLCGMCAASGRDLPRLKQLELLPLEEPDLSLQNSSHR